MEFAVCYEFAVSRRIPWEGDEDSLRTHIRDVRRRLEDVPSVDAVRAVSNLSTGNLSVEFRISAATSAAVDREVHNALGTAIRDSGAYHAGLYPAGEELKLRPRLSPWSGLKTPTWRVRRSSITPKRSISTMI